ncbi:MAG: indolepyruvate ferredoxin oxidoreductase family protein [Pseudolabrys sp.]|nr:indolepyruvate ferredoxin oxidoreductase family protein [Pseudolabrys sp.]
MSNRLVGIDDKYTATSGRVYLTGTQALVRLPISQHMRDTAAGLNTAGFISGYRGSPLGVYDQELWRAKKHLGGHNVHFQPGLNEEMAATAVFGSQQSAIFGKPKYDGVFGIWYGKNPGLDRAGDPIKHANAAGTSKHGGVLLVPGDDHAAKSSDLANQCEFALMNHAIPVLAPSDIQDVIDLGLYGWAMSRFSGCWVGLKIEPNVTDRSASVAIDAERIAIKIPEDFVMPLGGLNIRWPDNRFEQEARLLDFKLRAVEAFAAANPLNRIHYSRAGARIGIVTTGKAYSDVREALDELGIDERRAGQLGISVLKIGLSWPIEPTAARAFCEGLQEVIVVEEKRAVIEDQLRSLLFHTPESCRPRIVGKVDEAQRPLFSAKLEFDPLDVARNIGERIIALTGDADIRRRVQVLEQRRLVAPATTAVRSPYFCSGCPHSSSLPRPEGTRALAGIGCHWMALWVPDFKNEPSTQMGGEGANWIGQAPFTHSEHIFQNLGDGTYYHSGSLAIRAAIAAKVNITYKLLYNDAVAMTGGQPVEGQPTVAMITRQLAAEGVNRIVVGSDEPEKYGSENGFAPGVTVHHRDDLITVQRELTKVPGVSVLIYDQTCAAEKRRRRKRGTYPDPLQRMFINEAVCEGCGDCSRASNCISIEPLETEFGRKRQINQSSCNKDYSCNKGFCPSFVTVKNAKLRVRQASDYPATYSSLPKPPAVALDQPHNIVVTGIGGTGVVTIGALLGMAAHIEGKGCSVLDSIGLAQKNGAVVSYVRTARTPDELHTARIPALSADCMIACDVIVAAGSEAMTALRPGCKAILDSYVAPTAAFILDRDLDLDAHGHSNLIAQAVGKQNLEVVDAHGLAERLLGEAIASNIFMIGYAYQKGYLPVGLEALEQAITLNGVAVKLNLLAFAWGRLAAHDMAMVQKVAGLAPSSPVASVDPVERRAAFLTQYQDKAYAQRYRDFVATVKDAERAAGLAGTQLTEAVSRNYFKLLAYKDEYEVARLHTDTAFASRLAETFEPGFSIEFNMAPPLVSRIDPETGHRRKRALGSWLFPVLRLLALGKRLRGTPFDLFGWQVERQRERQLIGDYEATIRNLLPKLTERNYATAVQIAALPDDIRGFGHVKNKAMDEARKKQDRLLAEFAAPNSATDRSAA